MTGDATTPTVRKMFGKDLTAAKIQMRLPRAGVEAVLTGQIGFENYRAPEPGF